MESASNENGPLIFPPESASTFRCPHGGGRGGGGSPGHRRRSHTAPPRSRRRGQRTGLSPLLDLCCRKPLSLLVLLFCNCLLLQLPSCPWGGCPGPGSSTYSPLCRKGMGMGPGAHLGGCFPPLQPCHGSSAIAIRMGTRAELASESSVFQKANQLLGKRSTPWGENQTVKGLSYRTSEFNKMMKSVQTMKSPWPGLGRIHSLPSMNRSVSQTAPRRNQQYRTLGDPRKAFWAHVRRATQPLAGPCLGGPTLQWTGGWGQPRVSARWLDPRWGTQGKVCLRRWSV